MATREVPLVIGECALLVIDMQNYACHPEGPVWKTCVNQYYQTHLPRVVMNIRSMLDASRNSSVECIYTVIESLTSDGRDRSLDYKLSGINVGKGSWEAQVIEELSPCKDEVKTSHRLITVNASIYCLRDCNCIIRLSFLNAAALFLSPQIWRTNFETWEFASL